MCLLVPALAVIQLIDSILSGGMVRWMGIWPQSAPALRGVLFAPFVHHDWNHLLANSSPLIILGTFAFAAGKGRFFLATGMIMIISGLVVWYSTPPGILVAGASGVIFGWIGLLFVRGVVEHTWWHLIVAILVGALYGAQLQLIWPGHEGISWQGHLSGFITGMIAAFITRRPHPKPPEKK
jgi:membrane associated rhomboid family serine protease